MRKVTMVRLGIATAITALGVSGAMASGCTSSSTTGGGDGGSDGSTSSSGSSSGTSSSGTSSGSSSGSSSGDSGQTTPPANLIIVHAAPGLGPFRVCFAQASGGAAGSVEPFTALPDGPGAPGGPAIPPNPTSADGGGAVAPGTPGIYPGTIGALPTFGTSIQNLTITPYIIDASKIAGEYDLDGGAGVSPDGGAEDTCVALIGAKGKGTGDNPAGTLTPGVDYWQLPDIPATTLKDGNTYLMSLTGCLPGFQPSVSEQESAGAISQTVTAANICGTDFDGGTANLAISINQVDTTTVIAGGADAGIGLQFANASTAMQGNPFYVNVNPTGVTIVAHQPAAGGVLPGIPTEGVEFEDAGEDAAPNEVLVYGFNPISATPSSAPPGSGALPAAVAVPGLPLLNSDGGVGPAAFGVLTVPGTVPGNPGADGNCVAGDGGAANIGTYPFSATGGCGDQLALPFSGIFQLSLWQASTATSPPYFVPGQSYTIVLLGSNDNGVPQLLTAAGAPNTGAGGTYDGRGLHMVAFPNVFTPKQVP